MNKSRYILTGLLMASLLTACGSSKETAADYVESGKMLIQEGMLEKAKLEFKNAIQIDPRTAEAFYQLALLDEKSQKWKGMYANLSTAEQLDPTHHDAIVKLGQLFLLSGELGEAEKKVEKVLASQPEHVGAIILKASVEMKQENFGLGLKYIEQALILDTQNIEAMSVKAIIYRQQGNFERALSTLDKALDIKSDELSLIMIKLSILEEQKDYAEVEKIYRDLRVSKPDQIWVVASLAKLLNFQDKYKQAKLVIENFVQANPDDRDAKLLLVSLVKTHEPEQAIALLDSYIAIDESDYELYFAKIKMQLDGGEVQQAMMGLEEIIAKDVGGNDGRKAAMVLANYDFQKGNVEAVEERVSQVLSAAPEDEAALILKSKINLLNNNLDAAITDLRIVLRNNLNSDEAMVLLGQAYLQSDSEALAEDHFRQALSVNPGNQAAALFVAQKLLQTDNLDRAESVVTNALKETPTNTLLLQALADIKLRREDWDGANGVAKSLRAELGDSAVTAYLDGRILQGQGKYEASIDSYKNALSSDPSLFAALESMVVSYVQLGKKEELFSFLDNFVVQEPDDLRVYVLRYKLHSADKDWDKAIFAVEDGLVRNNQWQFGYMLVASAYEQKGSKEKVIAAYEKGLSAMPESNAIALQLASRYESQGDFSKAKKLYEDILERDENINVAINNLSSLLTDRFQSEENLQKALQISKSFENSDEPYFLDTYAWVNVKVGDLDKAQALLEKVVSKSPEVAVFNYHLGYVYQKKNQNDLADEYLKKAQAIAMEQGDDALIRRVEELLPAL